jgi:hypothetical protein
LIRLFEFDQSEACRLRQLVKSLADGDGQDVALQNEARIKSVGECRLNLRQGNGNHGVRQAGNLTFECVLTRDGWSNVEELLEPFCESDKAGFQWLTNEGHVALLISQNGQW